MSKDTKVVPGAKGAKKPADRAKTSYLEEIKKYFRGVWSELKKVHWPNRPELITYTGVVLVSVLVVSVLIWIVDSGLSQVIKLVLE